MEAILFDIGGTLLSEDGYDLEAGVRAALAAPDVAAAALRPERWSAELGRWIEEVVRDGHGGHSLQGWIRERLRPVGGRLPGIDAIEDSLWEAGVSMSAVPGAHEVLARAADRGLALAAVSNTIFSARRMHLALCDAGLGGALRFVLSSADEGSAKPDGTLFRIALERLGARAEHALFVGDSWENDVVGATSAGLQAAWISPRPHPHGGLPHRRIATIGELVPLLDEAT